MVMNDRDFAAIDKAAEEHFRYGVIQQKCTRCGSAMECVENGASYTVRCTKGNCISETFRGI